ncbi:uncharacterized protein N0V89_000285 [Didymosphaeria variabile]|uniref:Uncharacterized protein n=1 Tax=Didymosphaeria variabile TaxID=1932322 RepID=A0A9W8XX41_9PLEO|nr:uncharacterized protein N0V89_000285 [Didymosphaeria variabile]KAJ4359729.1 hypothetical protein N0V89_000285 [Didymosphaeria variabile]
MARSLSDQMIQVCRIQLRFASSEDFDVAYDHVRELGLWFTPTQKSRSAVPPTSTQRSGPACPPSQLSEVSERPGTAVPYSSAPSQNLKDVGLRPSTASFFDPSSTASSRRPDSAASLSTHEPSSRLPLSIRPDTANSILSSDLPPRRELPFERLDTADSTGTRPGSRPLSAMMGPPGMPASKFAGIKRPNSKTGSSHGAELAPLRKPTYISKTLTGQAAGLRAEAGSKLNARDTMRPQSAITQNTYTAMQHMMSSAPVLIPTTPRPASSYNTATTHLLNAVTNSHSQAETSVALATPPGSDINMLGSSPPQTKGNNEQHAEELATYAQQSNDARLSELNNFIFQHLQDDNFLTLVDDMQMTWARIGTGLE